MSFEIKPATRQGIKPLIGMYGRSGSGKTMSALYLARGLVGSKGRVCLVDSESGRGSIFADIIPGGYSVVEIDPPFFPERYQEAIDLAVSQADCVVVDSMSHEHNGEGGVLDMQEAELDRMAGKDNWEKREKCKMASWIKPKMEHKKFIQHLLRLPCGLICCLRGEEKTHMIKEDGKNKVITDQYSSPLFDQRFLFELLINFETIAKDGKGGYVIPRKITHPSVAALLPGENEQISIKTGEALAAWCKAPGGAPASKPATDIAAVKRELWELTKEKHRGDKKVLQQWVTDELRIDVPLDKMEFSGLQEVLEAAKRKLQDTGIMP